MTLLEGEKKIKLRTENLLQEPQPQLATSQLEEAIIASLNAWIEENGAPGTAVSVLLPDGSQVNVAAGSRDRNGTPASVNDYWRIASISKPITSAIVLKLVEQGKIEIDEPVMTYLGPEWAQGYVLDGIDYAPLITIRQILDHTDGFHEYAFGTLDSIYQRVPDLTFPTSPKKSLTGDLNEDRYSFQEPNIHTTQLVML